MTMHPCLTPVDLRCLHYKTERTVPTSLVVGNAEGFNICNSDQKLNR